MSHFTRHILLMASFSVLTGILLGQDAGKNYFLWGKAKIEAGQYDSALIYLNKAANNNSNPLDIPFYKGLALYHQDHYILAIQEFELVEKTSKGEASIWIARCYANLKDTDNCLNALEVHLNSKFKLPESTILLDRDLSVLENDPKYINFWKGGNWYTGLDQVLAEASYLIKLKQYPEAINILSEGIDKGYRKSPLFAKRAEVYMKVGNFKLALDDLDRSIEMDRRNPELLMQRANILYVTAKYKPALDDFNAAIKLKPIELDYYVGRAMAESKNGLYENAVNDLNLYLSYYPDNDTAWYQFGMIHYDEGNYFQAINSFNKSLKLSQKDARFFAARGATYLKTKTYRYAWKDLTMAVDLDPNDSQSFINKGIAALNLGDINDACNCFNMAKKLGNKEAFDLTGKYCKAEQ